MILDRLKEIVFSFNFLIIKKPDKIVLPPGVNREEKPGLCSKISAVIR